MYSSPSPPPPRLQRLLSSDGSTEEKVGPKLSNGYILTASEIHEVKSSKLGRRRILGTALFERIHLLERQHAPKVTGMLLELDTEEIRAILASPMQLSSRVAEAMGVLKAAGLS